jgi:restriction system protein
MSIIYHYPPELLDLLVDTIPLLFRSKAVLTFFQGAGVSSVLAGDLRTQVEKARDSITKYEIVAKF